MGVEALASAEDPEQFSEGIIISGDARSFFGPTSKR